MPMRLFVITLILFLSFNAVGEEKDGFVFKSFALGEYETYVLERSPDKNFVAYIGQDFVAKLQDGTEYGFSVEALVILDRFSKKAYSAVFTDIKKKSLLT